MISSRAQRRLRVIALRGIRGTRTHALTLLSAGVIATLATVALSSDAFQTSRVPVAPDQSAPPSMRYFDPGALELMIRLAWTPQFADLNPEQVAAYYQDVLNLTPLQRARLGVAAPSEPIAITLPQSAPHLTPEAIRELLIAMETAEGFGVRFQVTDLRTRPLD